MPLPQLGLTALLLTHKTGIIKQSTRHTVRVEPHTDVTIMDVTTYFLLIPLPLAYSHFLHIT